MEEDKKSKWPLMVLIAGLVFILPSCSFLIGFGAGWGANEYCGDQTTIVQPGDDAPSGRPDTTSLHLGPEQTKITNLQVSIGLKRGRSLRDIKIAIMTGFQESGNKNLAFGHAKSLGVYQQQVGSYWGSAAQILNPVYAINRFYSELEKVKDRASKTLMDVAMSVQRPNPDAYASPKNNFNSWESRANAILAGVKQDSPAGDSEVKTTGDTEITCESSETTTGDSPGDGNMVFPEGCPKGVPGNVAKTATGVKLTLCRVNGMVINSKIAAKWQYLVRLAKADGINLSGGGFRTAAQQISLRKSHCGRSHYAIYKAPSSACRPYTARPGRSMHELGLAVDLYNSSSFSSKVHKWMKVHGPKVGIYAKVPGEPWHWSLGGH